MDKHKGDSFHICWTFAIIYWNVNLSLLSWKVATFFKGDFVLSFAFLQAIEARNFFLKSLWPTWCGVLRDENFSSLSKMIAGIKRLKSGSEKVSNLTCNDVAFIIGGAWPLLISGEVKGERILACCYLTRREELGICKGKLVPFFEILNLKVSIGSSFNYLWL